MVAYAVGAGLENVHHGWRIIFALSLPFAIFQGAAMHWMPETPRFAVLVGDLEGAMKTLRKIYPKATEDQLNLKLKAIQLATEVSVSLKKVHPTIIGRLGAVFTTPQYFRCVLTASVIFLGQQLSGWNRCVVCPSLVTVLSLLPPLFSANLFSFSRSFLYYSATIFGAAGFTNVRTFLSWRALPPC